VDILKSKLEVFWNRTQSRHDRAVDNKRITTFCLIFMNCDRKSSQQIILVTGAARSGKSEWAETLAQASKKSVVYVATAIADASDREWQSRIEKHRRRRPDDWQTLQVPVELAATLKTALPSQCLLVDSLGTWVANAIACDEEAWETKVNELIASIQETRADLIFVAEETGWGVVPAYPVGRVFRDRLGNLIRRLGAIADPVYLVAGGRALNLSLLGEPLNNSKSP
jgi:adenosylcobinamide kinase/adenosylcobinamide-phosphate guanylyltransferase